MSVGGQTDGLLERLASIVEAQQVAIAEQGRQIVALTENTGLLVQAVAALLGEELGTPANEDESEQRTDLDGRAY